MKSKIAILILFASLVVVFFVAGGPELLNLDSLKSQHVKLVAYFQQHPYLTALSYFLIYVVVTALSVPGALIMTLAGGAIFGFWKGLVLVSFASTIGATLAFLIARYLFRESIQSRFGDKLKVIDKGIEQEGAFYVFGIRLVPIFPFFLVNLCLALTALKTTTFYWASQLGMLAGTAAYVNAGTQLANIESVGDIVSFELGMAFIFIGLVSILSKPVLNWMRNYRNVN